jgi:hypothetical protein
MRATWPHCQAKSFGVPVVVAFVLVIFVSAVVFIFIFVVIRLVSKKNIGRRREIVPVPAWIYFAHTQCYAPLLECLTYCNGADTCSWTISHLPS